MLRGLCVLSLSLFLGQALSIGDIRLVTPENQRDVTFVRQGSSIELQCVVEGGDVGTTYPVAWYYNNVPIDTGTGDGTLVLENSVIEQGGWYTCTASSNDRREDLDFLVIVGAIPDVSEVMVVLAANTSGDPRIDVNVPTTYVVQGGSRVELPCFTTGLPQPDVTWFGISDHKIYDQQENGRYRIDPITQSLIIFNFTEYLRQEMGPFRCVANNSFSNDSMSFDVRISGEVTPAVFAPGNFNLDLTQLHVEVDQNTAEQRLACADSNVDHRYKWFKNGIQNEENTTVLTISRSELGSGFYCCEIYRITQFEVLNTHCTTVWFQTRAILRQPTLPSNSHFYLPSRRKAALLCHGNTDIPSSVNNPKLHYGPPNMTWSSPGENGKYIIDDFSDEQGLAYRLVEVQPETSGLYNCSGGNFVNLVEERIVTIQYVDNSGGEQTVIVNGLAEKNESWSVSGSASVTTYRHEGVFMLSFPGSQSINNTWLMQDVIIPDGMQGVYISGRMRQSEPDGIYPVIQVFYAVDNVMKVEEMPHPDRSSDAWQWVDKYVSTNGATNLQIRLALKTDTPKEQKRQTGGEEGSVFFDDISVIPSCENGLTFCTDSNECLENCDDSSDGIMLYIIVGGAVGGAVLLLLVAIVIIICCCCCCRKGKSGARPMKKMTTLIKKASRRNQYKTKEPVTYTKNPDSPPPAEYEIPVQSELGVEYESIRGTYHSTNQNDGKNSEYTSLNPQSLEESTYYTTAVGSPYKREKNTNGGKAKQKPDEGGVEMYLEVRPSIPSQSSLADNSQPALTGLSGSGNKTSDIPSPDDDILDGDPLEYEYINADLGPKSK